ncbi:transcriptional regulator YeiL [Vagococcus intermedius]|uniref:Transcriptional regulator YeiL n=1 Tax=Vagococcus intermedius TaxID=2991418 RepID=A0AAF0CU83_9ENTE|nr:transcriptional regulator YeiL [Vagococcus intermedius]WEG73083.1 transcriptional regulator YeiL [Vagococcus intermedius]WEG75167.1 transcriptional regulator YeiL [Vagococcus intermedius]
MKKIRLKETSDYNHFWQPMKKMMSLPLEELAHLRIFTKGERIIRYNSGTDMLYILLEGKAKIYVLHEDGKQSIVHFVQNGELIGELSLLEVEERTKDVIAQTECVCLAIPLQDNREKLLNDVVFLQQLSYYLAEKVLNRTERFSEGLNYPLMNRLAAFILYTENDGFYHEKHTEVADYLGVSYRHLLYTFEQLRDNQVLKKDKPGYWIQNRAKLEALAKDS